MGKKINKFFKSLKKYIKSNILMSVFIISCLINGCLLRYFTVANYFAIKPVMADLTILLFFTSFGYFFKPKNQFKYLLVLSIFFTAICIVNSIYYSNYLSFASVSLLSTASELGGYMDALENIFEFKDLIFLWQIFALVFTHRKLKKSKYYKKVKNIEVPKTRFLNMIITSLITLGVFVSMLSPVDISRLDKQWNRSYVVMEFGIYTYQINDASTSLKTTMNSMFGYDDAYKSFREFYETDREHETNMYTNIFKGKNVIVIHGESLQSFTMNLKFNGKELTPNLNKLAREGIYFSNFYAQESVGNSSDSEFTSLTSLLPSSSGTVFMNYFDRDYETILKLLKNQDYYTFSMHANNGSAWNRSNTYKYLGYDNFYYYTKDYTIDEQLGLGLSDKSFFKQSIEILKTINDEHKKWYGTLIMLTNHTPFTALENDTSYSVDYIKTTTDELTGETKEEVIPWLEGTKMGNYLKSVHYADEAIGQLLTDLESSGLLDDTIIVLYGDHDCKLKHSEFKKLYDSEYYESVLIDPTDTVGTIDDFTYEINRKVPFIIWSKDKINTKYNKEYNDVMGMIDVSPTLENMLGITPKYNLGHDYFSEYKHLIVFPDGNWMTKNLYYEASSETYRQLDLDYAVSMDEINDNNEYADNLIKISNSIITYNLIDAYEKRDELVK